LDAYLLSVITERRQNFHPLFFINAEFSVVLARAKFVGDFGSVVGVKWSQLETFVFLLL